MLHSNLPFGYFVFKNKLQIYIQVLFDWPPVQQKHSVWYCTTEEGWPELELVMPKIVNWSCTPTELKIIRHKPDGFFWRSPCRFLSIVDIFCYYLRGKK